MRAKAVADGQRVDIPALRIYRTVGTQEGKQTGEWKNPDKDEGVPERKNRPAELKSDVE